MIIHSNESLPVPIWTVVVVLQSDYNFLCPGGRTPSLKEKKRWIDLVPMG